MAFMNLLSGKIIGTLGTVYGARTRNGAILKAVPFSKAPPSPLQVKSVRAFESLNRIAVPIAKRFWPYLKLSEKNMLRHNAVAQWLKPCISQNTFDPYKISQVIPPDGSIEIHNFIVDQSESIAMATISALPPALLETKGALMYVLFLDDGKVIHAGTSTQSSFSFIVPFLVHPGRKYHLLAFRTDIIFGLKLTHGFAIKTVLVPDPSEAE